MSSLGHSNGGSSCRGWMAELSVAGTLLNPHGIRARDERGRPSNAATWEVLPREHHCEASSSISMRGRHGPRTMYRYRFARGLVSPHRWVASTSRQLGQCPGWTSVDDATSKQHQHTEMMGWTSWTPGGTSAVLSQEDDRMALQDHAETLVRLSKDKCRIHALRRPGAPEGKPGQATLVHPSNPSQGSPDSGCGSPRSWSSFLAVEALLRHFGWAAHYRGAKSSK